MSACVTCGRWCPSGWYQNPATATQCGQVACMACGISQCHGNGLRRGTCKHCHYGALPGWSWNDRERGCSYKGCTEPAVYRHLPGPKKQCCKRHGDAVLARRVA